MRGLLRDRGVKGRMEGREREGRIKRKRGVKRRGMVGEGK